MFFHSFLLQLFSTILIFFFPLTKVFLFSFFFLNTKNFAPQNTGFRCEYTY